MIAELILNDPICRVLIQDLRLLCLGLDDPPAPIHIPHHRLTLDPIHLNCDTADVSRIKTKDEPSMKS